ncbi:MAG: hypothetical protein CML02_02315 [Pseudooceanicola sp.]|nr:hypothetical protein [Pseudooceanicola sp.]|tara:strand:+ start:2846 stop:3097 length:252 start_codon:yes stop_codon:yes gene_type:complete
MTQHVLIEATSLEEHTRRIEAMESRIERLCAALEAVQVQREPEWLKVNDYAKRFEITPRTVNRWIDEGKLKARGAGRAREVKL